MPFKLCRLLRCKPYASKTSSNPRSQTFRVAGQFRVVPLCADAVAEKHTDFIGQRAAVPYGSTLKESLDA